MKLLASVRGASCAAAGALNKTSDNVVAINKAKSVADLVKSPKTYLSFYGSFTIKLPYLANYT